MLAVQTNNATFGRSAESVQQLAMSQLRAIENGRTVVHISTVGVSAIILPDGTVQQRSGHFRQEVLESDIPLRTSLTLATRVGVWPEAILAALGVALLIGGALAGRRRQGPAAPSGLREPRPDAPVTATVATAATAETKGLRGNDNGVRIRSA